MQGLYPWASLRAYAHYVRRHKAQPSLTNCISAKVQPFQLLCRVTYNMKHIIYLLQSFGPLDGLSVYGYHINPHIVHPSFTNSISAKVQPSQLLCRHTYNMQHIIYILQSFRPSAGPRAYAHYISPHKAQPSLTHCISATVSPFCTL